MKNTTFQFIISELFSNGSFTPKTKLELIACNKILKDFHSTVKLSTSETGEFYIETHPLVLKLSQPMQIENL